MSLLESNLHRAGSASPAGAALQRRAAAVVSLLLLASTGCSFDSAPETGGRTDPASGAGWKPNGGASQTIADAAIDSSSERSGAGTGGSGAKSTQTMRPAAAGSGGSKATPTQGQKSPDADLDAGASEPPNRPNEPADPPPRDAGSTTKPPSQPQQPPQQPIDASTTNSRCKPGVYTGTFSGSLQLIGVTLSPVTGTVRATLELSQSGDHLNMRDGHVVGVDQDGNRLTCGISGSINCDSFELEDGLLEDGNFHNVGSDSDTAFNGSVQATYSREPPSLVGTFQVEATDTSLFTGRGTWNLIRSP